MLSKSHSLSTLDPADTKTDLSCSTAKLIMFYMEDRFGTETMEEFFLDMGMSPDYVRNSNNWISFDFNNRLLQKLVDFTKNPKAPYEVGLMLPERRSFGAIETLGARLGTARSSYRLLPILSPRWNKVATWKHVDISDGKCKIEVKNHDYPQDKNNCLCIQGCLASVPMLHGMPHSRVKEIQCACEGAESCIYDITWIPMPDHKWFWVTGVVGIGVALSIRFISEAAVPALSLGILSMAGFLIGHVLDYKNQLKRVYARSDEQATFLQESLTDIENLNKDLQRRVEERTDELTKANTSLKVAILEQKKSEQIALMAERQATIGVLAAGMAHEMNNPINAIRLSIQTLQKILNNNEKACRILENAGSATSRCTRIVGDLLTFARKDQCITKVDLKEVLNWSIDIFKREDTGQVNVDLDISDDIPQVYVDEKQMQQAILNLMTNASDAMKGRGKIKIALKRDGTDIVLTHEDTGPGVSDELKERIFDPFFSTKTSGTSKGLGLSITMELVRRNGGYLDLFSSSEKGACFRIRFPSDAQRADGNGIAIGGKGRG